MLGLARGLLELGCEVTVVCHDFDPSTDLSGIADHVEVRSIHTGEVRLPANQRGVWDRLFRGMPRVAALVPDDAEVVNAHEHPAVRAGRIAARRLKAPLVWTRNDDTMVERGLRPERTTVHPGSASSRIRHALYGLPELRDGHAAEEIVVLDERNAELASGIYRRPARIVRSGPGARFFDPPPREEARRRLGVAAGELLVLALGILFPHRRFEDLIEALAALPGVRGRLVGWDGFAPQYADMLEGLIRERHVGGRVTLERRSVDDNELRALYAAADVFVFPNQRQTWGLAPLEALAAGTPVVLSSGAGVHEVLDGRPGVWTVPPETPMAIAAAIAQVRDTADARLLAEATRRWIRTELNRRRYAEEMLRLFRDALG